MFNKLLKPLLIAAAFLLLPVMNVSATDSVPINEQTFPDPVFREYVLYNFDTDGNGHLSSGEASSVENIDIYSRGITSVRGIEYFTNLKTLNCERNKLTVLDTSSNTQLTRLDCNANNIVELNITGNKDLSFLDCSYNNLYSIDLSGCNNLRILWCHYNELNSLNVNANEKLTTLGCYGNNLSSIDVGNNKLLRYFNCMQNELTSIDTTNNPKLETFYCNENNLRYLDISNNLDLVYLNCGENNLSSVNAYKHTKLQELYCDSQDVYVYKNAPTYTLLDPEFSSERVSDSNGLVWNGNTFKVISESGNRSYVYNVTDDYSITIMVRTIPNLTYDDVVVAPGNWKYDSIKYVTDKGLMKNISCTNSFYPDRSVTRAELVTILYRLYGSPSVDYSPRFSDVPSGQWYSNAVMWAYQCNIVSGYSDGTFGVNGLVNREQTAKILAEYARRTGHSLYSTKSLDAFVDYNDVSSWATSYVKWVVEKGIISGKPLTATTCMIDPKGYSTRAELAKMLKVLIEL